MLRNHHDITGPVHGRRDTMGSYPETRAPAETRNISQPQPVITQATDTVSDTAPGYERPVVV
jgi:hypothetical protein